MAAAPIPCVGAVVRDAGGRLLLVLRRNPPAAGTWSLPGGRVEAGEDDAAALAREVREETGLTVVVGAWVGTVHRDAPGGGTYEIRDYACTPLTAGRPVAGDDAADVRWADTTTLHVLDTAPGLVEALSAWGILSRSTPAGS